MKRSKLRFSMAAVIAAGMLTAGCAATSDEAIALGDDDVALRIAILGDAEPKPEPVFPGVQAAVRDVNRIAEQKRIDFVIGVGDLAHKGTEIQYDNVTPLLQELSRPFYPIMGNEELGSTLTRYLEYARRWNPELEGPRYVQDRGPVVLVHASPDVGRDFNDESIDWMLAQIRAAKKPVLLVVHSAQAGVYPENADKGVKNPRFAEVVAEGNVAAVISGDLHMDMDRTDHSKQIGNVHYLHIPALERTKIPDETTHVPMFRTLTITDAGEVLVKTYRTGDPEPLDRHEYRFSLAPYVTAN